MEPKEQETVTKEPREEPRKGFQRPRRKVEQGRKCPYSRHGRAVGYHQTNRTEAALTAAAVLSSTAEATLTTARKAVITTSRAIVTIHGQTSICRLYARAKVSSSTPAAPSQRS